MTTKQRTLYLLPAICMTVIFFIVPFVYLLYVGFFQWDGLTPMKFVGIGNYRKVLADPVFRISVRNTIIWMLTATFIHVPLGLLLAFLLDRRPRGWKVYRFAFFIPNIISTTAIAFLWYFLYHVDLGLINGILELIGLGTYRHGWLNEPATALFCNQVPFALYVGLTMVIFMTQLSTISPDIFEAARIDGAVGWRKDWYISLPLVRPAIITNLMLNLAFCLKTFEYPFLMTGGGPANSTMNLSLYIYREMMQSNRYGYSMVGGLATIILGCIVMGIILWVQKRMKEEEL
ncbi:carbohydrate ABC transporter permease [Sediminispirochaeta smaragdinae]|uniref:Binding-protein-dependent transport systems inner membrane component n=1 Tax=Sediminispirochaeta smaragdinae (strain DSM 11293 / JCM 15392 / SEBR 4228) TaxID=573413 RepID=E1R9V1_SEDSS|nr:sugar ABC transporter permease [Sediminispirochaeta smaragdinae]ADK83270.1 binding-protein-dependent transport systems inner membrane component [Sediminispirochaeta smaragdinae DSM 11293]